VVKLADDTRVRVPKALVNGSTSLQVGIRPEKIRLSEPANAPAGGNVLRGVVRDASYIGVSTQYIVEASGGARLTVYEQNVERATKAELWAPGENVVLTWAPDHSFVINEPAPTAPVEEQG
jgi:spermidine/putrescine transport system ATP-binding protein